MLNNSMSIYERKSMYIQLYNTTNRSSIYDTKDIDRAIKFFGECPEALKNQARILALTEIFKQLKLVMSRLDRTSYNKDDLLTGKLSPTLSRTLIESTKHMKRLDSYLKLLDTEIDILGTVLEVNQ